VTAALLLIIDHIHRMSGQNNGNEEVLDLTNSHLPNLESVTLAPGLQVNVDHLMHAHKKCVLMQPTPCPQVLDLTANRLSSIDPRILALTGEAGYNGRNGVPACKWHGCMDGLGVMHTMLLLGMGQV
jgi:hypothetical protein